MIHDHAGDSLRKDLAKKAKKLGLDIGEMLCGIHCCWYIRLDKNFPNNDYGCRCKFCKEIK